MFIPLPDISTLQGKRLVCQGCKTESFFLATDNRVGTRRCACGGILVPTLMGTALMAASAFRVLQSDSRSGKSISPVDLELFRETGARGKVRARGRHEQPKGHFGYA
jgi:hypothetical protein